MSEAALMERYGDTVTQRPLPPGVPAADPLPARRAAVEYLWLKSIPASAFVAVYDDRRYPRERFAHKESAWWAARILDEWEAEVARDLERLADEERARYGRLAAASRGPELLPEATTATNDAAPPPPPPSAAVDVEVAATRARSHAARIVLLFSRDTSTNRVHAAEAFAEALSAAGFLVVHADTADDAVERARALSASVAVVDFAHNDPWRIVAELRAVSPRAAIVCMVWEGETLATDLRFERRYRARLVKQPTPGELVAAVQHEIERESEVHEETGTAPTRPRRSPTRRK